MWVQESVTHAGRWAPARTGLGAAACVSTSTGMDLGSRVRQTLAQAAQPCPQLEQAAQHGEGAVVGGCRAHCRMKPGWCGGSLGGGLWGRAGGYGDTNCAENPCCGDRPTRGGRGGHCRAE